MKNIKYPPVALIVDDDVSAIRFLSKNFLNYTNMGVVTAGTLPEAQKLISEGKIRFDALVTDLYFEEPKQAQKLKDGVDLLEFVSKKRGQDFPKYCVSVWAQDDAYRDRAHHRGVHVDAWLPKFDERPGEDRLTTWASVERDLLVKTIGKPQAGGEPIERDTLLQAGIADSIRNMQPCVRLTYHQFSNIGLKLRSKAPIEVHCWQENGSWCVDAHKIGLLQPASADELSQALVVLEENLDNEFSALEGGNMDKMKGYAKFVADRLVAHVERITKAS